MSSLGEEKNSMVWLRVGYRKYQNLNLHPPKIPIPMAESPTLPAKPLASLLDSVAVNVGTTEVKPKTSKLYVTADKLLADSFRLANMVYEDEEFRPTWILALWRGGTPIGCAVQEYLTFCGCPTDHISIRTSHYCGLDERSQHVRIHGLRYVVQNCNVDDHLLIVDDVFDTGKSVQAVISSLKRKMRTNFPRNVRCAVVYYKPTRNLTDRVPEYFIHSTDQWIVFPHELVGLQMDEIREGKGEELWRMLEERKTLNPKKKYRVRVQIEEIEEDDEEEDEEEGGGDGE